MCTYATIRTELDGSAKGPGGSWFHVSTATAYVDHPVHAMAEHTLNLDLADPAAGPSARVAVELTTESAEALVAAIQAALATVPVVPAAGHGQMLRVIPPSTATIEPVTNDAAGDSTNAATRPNSAGCP